MTPAVEFLKIWGQVHQIRAYQDKSPIEIALSRAELGPFGAASIHRESLREENPVGYGSPVFRSDGPAYPRLQADRRVVDDPHPAAFVFLTIERYLMGHPVMKALAHEVYVREKSPGSFRYRSLMADGGGDWAVGSKRTAERTHQRLKKAVQTLFENDFEVSLSEEVAHEMASR